MHKAENLLIAFVGELTGTKVASNRPIRQHGSAVYAGMVVVVNLY